MILGVPIDLLLMRATALLVVVAAHGYTVAFAATLLGDPGPRADRRLTPNALRHLDPIGVPAFVFSGGYGWIRQITIDPLRLRFGRLALVLVVLASVGAGFLVAVLAMLLAAALGDAAAWAIVPDTLRTIAATAIAFALFNLLPLPPLTGGLLLAVVAPPVHRWLAERALFPALLIAILLADGVVQDWLDPVVAKILATLPS